MRLAVFILLAFAIGSAQFEGTESVLSDCQERCCGDEGGVWDDGAGTCGEISGDAMNRYQGCGNVCLEMAADEVGYSARGAGNVCCAPGAIIFSIAACAYLAGRTGA